MDSSASDSRKQIACTTNFSKLSKKKIYIILVNILLHICFITFFKRKNSKESRTQRMLMSSKQSWLKLQLQLYKMSSRKNYIYLNRTTCSKLYQSIQFSLPCTKGQLLMGAKLFIWTPKSAKQSCSKNKLV